MQVTMTVNGEQVTAEVEPRMLLVHFLRDQLRLTGTHWGCDTSNCGTCVVDVDGEPVKSCTMLAAMASGHDVRTVEGLEVDGELDPVQEGFMQCHGLQCGFCTPGMMITARALLDRNPTPARTPSARRSPARSAAAPGTPRSCGRSSGRPHASAAGEPGADEDDFAPDAQTDDTMGPEARRSHHSRRGARHDHRRDRRRTAQDIADNDKKPCGHGRMLRKEDPRFIRGRGNYVDDVNLPGMLHLAILRSPYAHARITSIDVTAAQAHPKVKAVVTGADLAAKGLAWMPTLSNDVQAVLATDKVRFQGQEVAFVVAEDRYSARDALELIDVEYEAARSRRSTPARHSTPTPR